MTLFLSCCFPGREAKNPATAAKPKPKVLQPNTSRAKSPSWIPLSSRRSFPHGPRGFKDSSGQGRHPGVSWNRQTRPLQNEPGRYDRGDPGLGQRKGAFVYCERNKNEKTPEEVLEKSTCSSRMELGLIRPFRTFLYGAER